MSEQTKKYNVPVTETYYWEVEVEATSPEEALSLVQAGHGWWESENQEDFYDDPEEVDEED